MTLPRGPNQRWSVDFVADVLDDGCPFRALVVVDDFIRECRAPVVDTLPSGHRPHTGRRRLTPDEFAARSRTDHNQNAFRL
jgi:hypothetical protein